MLKINSVRVACPYCLHEVPALLGEGCQSAPSLALCDMEDGGCDRYFVVGPVQVFVSAESFAIDGAGRS